MENTRSRRQAGGVTAVTNLKLSRRLRWVLFKAAVREEFRLVWATRDLRPRRWVSGIRRAHKLKRDVQASLDRALLFGEGDDA